MYFEDFYKSIICTDLETKKEITAWFDFQRAEMKDRYEQVAGWDGTEADMEQWQADNEELERWHEEFLKLGLISR